MSPPADIAGLVEKLLTRRAPARQLANELANQLANQLPR